MLRYEIRLGKDNFKQGELEWGEKYVSPDLSYVTGVTDPSYNLETHDKLSSSNSIINSESILSVDAHNVIRQGFVIASGKTYDVHSGTTIDYSINDSGDTIDYHYLFINGKYFYWDSGYTIDNMLVYEDGLVKDDVIIEIGEDKAPETATTVSADTIYWIEDGKVVIDGEEYIYDANEGDNGILKYGENGIELEASAITECETLVYHPYSSSTQYKTVTKFRLDKSQEISEPFSKISFCKYYYFIKYKNHYCQIKKVVSGDTFEFVCEIPDYVLSGGTSLEPRPYSVYYLTDNGDTNLRESYRLAVDNGQLVNSDNYESSNDVYGHGVKNLDELKNIISFVYVKPVSGGDDVCITVEHDIMNANYGSEIAIYLENIYSPLNVGENIELVDTSSERYSAKVYNSNEYGGQDELFVLYNGNKYMVEKELCDRVEINTVEYDIDYVNGKEDGKDCLVLINGEEVPMMISGDTLKRYGAIVSGNSEILDAYYKINTYSGVTIDGQKCPIYTSTIIDGTETSEVSYADIGLPNKYLFSISDILGNSMYVCKPYLNGTYFTDDFSRYISEEMCTDVVTNQNVFDVQVKNKIFGELPITEDLPFRVTDKPKSSDDYYNLFSDLKIFVDNGYISIPLSLSTSLGNNPLQDNLIERDFIQREKEKVINPIVDMEKDIYVPKYFNGKYSGSSTDFKPINEINLNFHFRTRSLDSWKVNDGYNNVLTSGDSKNQSTDNWFITDFYPYREILSESGDTLQEASDLMGLLYFTNDDIFYQRSKVAKSFARLSFYDSTDPQTQSLLATSCVFLNEHALFKKFTDNSRKNLYEYGEVKGAEYSADSKTGFIIYTTEENKKYKTDITELRKFNKISVITEFLGSKKDNIPYSAVSDSSGITIDEGHRLSSRMTIENKYATDTSSEGFYLYMFKEYAENLHPKPIYMKIEFNHSGIGKQIPFTIPMHWTGQTSNSSLESYNKMYPDHVLKLSSSSGVTELKEGIPLSYTYAQSYIPLYAVYDFKNKEYAYVFDNRYVKVDDNGIANLNLFEMKIKNDDKTPSEEELKDITYNKPLRGIININEEQFNKEAFNQEVQ